MPRNETVKLEFLRTDLPTLKDALSQYINLYRWWQNALLTTPEEKELAQRNEQAARGILADVLEAEHSG